MIHFLSWPSGCSARDRSQLRAVWEAVKDKLLYVCEFTRTQTHFRCHMCTICGWKGSLTKLRERLYLVSYKHTLTTLYLFTGQGGIKASGSPGSPPQTNWALTDTFRITQLQPLVPGQTRGTIIESGLASESMTQKPRGEPRADSHCWYVGLGKYSG